MLYPASTESSTRSTKLHPDGLETTDGLFVVKKIGFPLGSLHRKLRSPVMYGSPPFRVPRNTAENPEMPWGSSQASSNPSQFHQTVERKGMVSPSKNVWTVGGAGLPPSNG